MDNRKIIGYEVVRASYASSVSGEVNNWIKKGYEPVGELQVLKNVYIQVVHKYEEVVIPSIGKVHG